MRKSSTKSLIAGLDVGAALASLPALIDAVRTAMDGAPEWEDERTETEALLAGLEPILTKAVRSTDADHVGYCARQALVLLGQLREVFPQACQDIPRAERAMESIGGVQKLLGFDEAAEEHTKSSAARAIDIVDEERWNLAHSANFEINLLAEQLLTEIMDGDRDAFELRIMARGMLKRIADLSGITHEALFLGDEKERDDVEKLQGKLGAPAFMYG
jgi:hypothetical protein